MMKSFLRIATSLLALSAASMAADKQPGSHHTEKVSPKRTFRIEQRSRPEEGDSDSTLLWQSWIVPANGESPYRLALCHDGELNWPGLFEISPNERFISHVQKTGSGDNYGALFARDADGLFRPTAIASTPLPFSNAAWKFFQQTTQLKIALYHDGVEFLSWGDDGKCFEFSLHGTDTGESYWISDWRLHFNTETGRFFCTPSQKKHNLKSIHYRRR